MNFRHFDQIAYATTDMARAIDIMERRHSVSGFRIYDARLQARVGDKTGPMEVRVAKAKVGDVIVELVEPHIDLDRYFSRVLPADGSFAMALHHTGVVIRGARQVWDSYVADYKAQGRVHFTAENYDNDGGDVQFFFSDERGTLGHHVEHLWFKNPQ